MKLKHVVSGLIALSVIGLAGCSTTDLQNIASNGNAMSTTGTKLLQANPNKVKLFYSAQGLPRNYTMVGRVSAEVYNVVGLEHTQSTIAEELKKQAASIGANGVMNINSGLMQVTGDAVLIK